MGTFESIAVIGAGSMGRPMAENLIRAGYAVTVCDIRADALVPFAAGKAKTCTAASECAAADCVIVMVGDDSDVADVTTGPNGLLDAIEPSRPPVVVVMSSVLPRTILTAADALSAKSAIVIDAPVSGGPVRAAAATMSIMVGGPDDVFARLEPVFAVLGRPVFRCGPVGAAAGVKIVNNILGVANMLLMSEAGHLATALDIDLKFLTGVMEVSSGRNSATQDFAGWQALHRNNAGDLDVTGRLLAILRKDLKLAATLARESGVGAPVLDAVSGATSTLTTDDLFARWQKLFPPD